MSRAAPPASGPVRVGRIVEIWRFPVKSMQGLRLDEATLTASGLVGDRDWALRDEQSGELTSAKRLPALLGASARHVEAPAADTPTDVEIKLPDGTRLASTDLEQAGRELSRFLDRPVTLWPRRPASDRAHYRKRRRVGTAETREVLGLEPDEPFPDLSSLPLATLADLMRFTTPPGSYVDACPLHMLTTGSLAAMRERAPGSDFDVRRFRPNLLVETEGSDAELPEEAWIGGVLRVGEARIRVLTRTVRCSMPARAQPELAADPDVARTVSRANGRHLGVYASVETPGRVRVDDEVLLEPDLRPGAIVAGERAVMGLKRAALGVARRILR